MSPKTPRTGGVIALSTTTGEVLWTFPFGGVADTNGGLALGGGTVYATTLNGELFALDAATGTKRWRVSGKNITLETPPAVGDRYVYASSHSAIYGVDPASGAERWHLAIGTSPYGAYMTVADGTVFAALLSNPQSSGPDAGRLFAVDGTTGKRRWTVPVAGGPDLAPAVVGQVVYIGTNDGVLEARHTATGAQLWSYSGTTGQIGTNLVVAGGVVYFGDGGHHLYAVAA
jgi:outer membrane protein assembly factor BamB